MNDIYAAQQDTPDKGKLQINLTSEITSYPVADASIYVVHRNTSWKTLLLSEYVSVKKMFLILYIFKKLNIIVIDYKTIYYK